MQESWESTSIDFYDGRHYGERLAGTGLSVVAQRAGRNRRERRWLLVDGETVVGRYEGKEEARNEALLRVRLRR